MAAKKQTGAKARFAEAAAEYRTQALGEVFWLASQQLSQDDQRAFMTRLLEDEHVREDLMDSIVSISRRDEPTVAYREVREELIREGRL